MSFKYATALLKSHQSLVVKGGKDSPPKWLDSGKVPPLSAPVDAQKRHDIRATYDDGQSNGPEWAHAALNLQNCAVDHKGRDSDDALNHLHEFGIQRVMEEHGHHFVVRGKPSHWRARHFLSSGE